MFFAHAECSYTVLYAHSWGQKNHPCMMTFEKRMFKFLVGLVGFFFLVCLIVFVKSNKLNLLTNSCSLGQQNKKLPVINTYLCYEWFGCRGVHYKNSPSQSISVAVQFFYSHSGKEPCNHFIDVVFYFLQCYIHSLLRYFVQKLLYSTDI